MLLGHAACVMDELPFSSYFWGHREGSHGLQVFPAPVKTGLLLTREERDVCLTRLTPGGKAGYPRRGF